MYNINSKWNKTITGIINNISWIIVIAVSVLTVLFTQLGTNHYETGNLSDMYASYETYGKIKKVVAMDIAEGQDNLIFVSMHYQNIIDILYNEISAHETILEQGYEVVDDVQKPLSISRRAYFTSLIEGANESIEQNKKELSLITSRVMAGITENTLIKASGQQFSWVGEYRYDKILQVAATDVYSWVLVLMLAFSASLVKIQGNKTGKNSGFKLVWKTMLRHATLSEKIAPKSVEAEEICIRMNEDELKSRRTKILQRVSLAHEDVFTEEGMFLASPNIAQEDIISYVKNGKTKYKNNPYIKKLIKRQRSAINKLKKMKIKEVHTYILLESKAEAREKYDFGESLKKRDRRTIISNIATSFVTALPMFTAASIFVITDDKNSLLIGGLGILLNFTSLLFNMFSSYDYIVNTWNPNLLKKCDALLSIAIELGVADSTDRNWDETVERELLASQNK